MCSSLKMIQAKNCLNLMTIVDIMAVPSLCKLFLFKWF
jgi:hypothetical protein